MDEILSEFVAESRENLSQLDHDLVELEKDPQSAELLASVFRTFHTIKGVAGFLNFFRLEAVAHAAEDLLGSLRDGQLLLDSAITSALLAADDAVRQMLAAVEADGTDGPALYTDVITLLTAFRAYRSAVDEPVADSGEDSGLETSAPATNSSSDRGLPGAAAPVHESTIRVNVQLLDDLMNLVGELVLVRNQVLQCGASTQEGNFQSASQRLNLITSALQEGIMKTRMQPIGTVWNKFPRIARDLARTSGKQVRIEMEGTETELDKTLIEAIRDPLTHIIRNAIDHGIETPAERLAAGKSAEGRLRLRAFHESGQVIVEIDDDGAGIDPDRVRAKALECGLLTAEQAAGLSDSAALKLIFRPGFSTTSQISNLSGRGVGMDVVRTNIEKIGGTVDVHSQRGAGMRLHIKIPLTLAIIPALVVTCAGDRFAIPQINLIELARLDGAETQRRIEFIHGAPVCRLRGDLLPLVYLVDLLRLAEANPVVTPDDSAHIVVLQIGDQHFGLVVDQINDTEEIVVKPLGKRLNGVGVYAGATIMGDGRVAMILDVLGIMQWAAVGEVREGRPVENQKSTHHGVNRQQRWLLCRTKGQERIAVPLALVSRLEEFPPTAIERARGCPVVAYRGRLLPLVDLGQLTTGHAAEVDHERGQVRVVVFDNGHQRVGVIVSEVIDIVEEEPHAMQLSSHPGLLGSALLGKQATDFLDLRAVFDAARERWYNAHAVTEVKPAGVLVIDQSGFMRGLVAGYLEMAGHRVHQAAGEDEALAKLERFPIQVATVSTNLPGNGRVLAQLRRQTREGGIALIGLADDRGELSPDTARNYDAFHFKSDRCAILESVEKLSLCAASREAESGADDRPDA
jgi:two-component system chemotaxis sensor kinase CheA